jgi:hypothetical protein
MLSAVLTLLGFIGLRWFFFGGFRRRQAERFQDEMVRLRRKMDAWAHFYSIPFDDPAFSMLRDVTVGMTSISPRAMLFSFTWNRDTRPETFSHRLEVAFGSLDESARTSLLHFRHIMHLIAFRYLLRSPAIAITGIAPLLAWSLIKYPHVTFLAIFEPAFDRLDDHALAKARELDANNMDKVLARYCYLQRMIPKDHPIEDASTSTSR